MRIFYYFLDRPSPFIHEGYFRHHRIQAMSENDQQRLVEACYGLVEAYLDPLEPV